MTAAFTVWVLLFEPLLAGVGLAAVGWRVAGWAARHRRARRAARQRTADGGVRVPLVPERVQR